MDKSAHKEIEYNVGILGALMISERQRLLGTSLAKAILVCGCLPFALQGQVTATWTAGGGDNNWSDGNNWNWDNSECQGPNDSPGSFLNNTSPCYTANVMIGGGFTVNVNVQFSSVIQNFSLGSGSTLNGTVNPEGNAMVASGAVVDGGINAATGVLTNQGTITGFASAATIVNSGKINGSGLVFASTAGTNTGTIEALGPGGGPYLTGTGMLQFTGPWNNAGGTIQIDNGATMVCDATITNGNLDAYGTVGGAGSGLTIAGTVSSTSLTIDGVEGPTTVTITGTLNVHGTLTVGQTASVSTLQVTNSGTLSVTEGNTIVGAQMSATGQLEISSTNAIPATTGNLIIGAAGSGYVQVSGGASLNAGVVTIGSQPSGNGELNVGGIVNYVTLNAIRGSTTYGSLAISVFGKGNLVGAANQQSNDSPADNLSGIAQVDGGTWKVQSGLTVGAGGSLTISQGGALSSHCASCNSETTALKITGNSTVDVMGSMSTLAADGSEISAGATLTVHVGANANFELLDNDSGTVTVDGSGSQLNVNRYSSDHGATTVQNQAILSASFTVSVGEPDFPAPAAKLTVQSGGVVSTDEVTVWCGGMLVQTGGALNMTGTVRNIDIGDSTTPGVLTISGTGKLGSAQYLTVDLGGALQITNGGSANISKLVSLKVVGSLVPSGVTVPGPTINVLQGALTIGTVSGPGTQGWVTVGSGGTLEGGVICPQTPSPASPCIPNSLVGPGTVDGSVSNVGGTVRLDPTTLNVTQDYQQTNGTLDLEIQGTQSGEYDQITAGGTIQISGGTVEFDFGNGFAPSSGDKFNLLSAPGGISTSGTSFTTTGLANGFNYTTGTSNNQFDLTATNSGTATTSAPAPPPTPTLTSVDAASSAMELAPGSLASGYGSGLATGQPATAPYVWPTTIDGTSVTIVDVTGATTQAPLLYVSPTLVNYQIPDNVAPGPATVTVTATDGTMATGPVNLVPYAPGLFAVNTAGLSASFADCVSANGTQSTVLTSQVVNGALVAVPLNLKACQETVLELWATGLDAAEASLVQATIGGETATVLYAGPEGVYPGVDQVNVVIPQSLAGAGNVPVVVTAGGVTSNTVNVTIQ